MDPLFLTFRRDPELEQGYVIWQGQSMLKIDLVFRAITCAVALVLLITYRPSILHACPRYFAYFAASHAAATWLAYRHRDWYLARREAWQLVMLAATFFVASPAAYDYLRATQDLSRVRNRALWALRVASVETAATLPIGYVVRFKRLLPVQVCMAAHTLYRFKPVTSAFLGHEPGLNLWLAAVLLSCVVPLGFAHYRERKSRALFLAHRVLQA